MRYSVAIRFAIEGDLRFISHHDTMRLFERALARARVPVKYSQGFNPRPRLSLPVPRPVGIATEADLLVVELEEEMEPQAVLSALASQMPFGLRLAEAWTSRARRIPEAERVEYALDLHAGQAEAVCENLGRILAAQAWVIERHSSPARPAAKKLDLRAFLVGARLEGDCLTWAVRVTNQGTVRPAEFVSAIGLSPEEVQHRVRRIAIHWRADDPGAPEEAAVAAADGQDLRGSADGPPAHRSEQQGCHKSR